jgi:succinate dehydrogenase / fumarate reductase, cytochrome b subunit
VKDVRDALMVGRTSDGKLVARPLSPHLQVYKWPVSMALSIGHRVSGVGVSIGAALFTWWLVAAAASEGAFATVQGFLGSGFGIFLLFCWAAALLFHLCTGIRHLFWDAGLGFDNRIYRTTGWGVIGATIVLTLIVWIVGMVVR